jgi:hypothetical protein
MGIALKASGTSTSNGFSTGSISWTAGSRPIVLTANAAAGGGTVTGVTISGGGATWTALNSGGLNIMVYGSRRAVHAQAANSTPTDGALTITVGVTGTFQECKWAVLEVTGTGLTFDECVRAAEAAASILSSPDVGTIDPGDLVVFAAGFEGATDGLVVQAGSIEVHKNDNGGNVRSLIVGTSTTDDTPGIDWNTGGNSAGIVAFVVNGGAAVATFAITAVGTLRYGESAVITVENANATGKRVFIDGVEQTVTAQDATSITITVVRGGLKYGTGKTLMVIDGGAASPNAADTESVSLLPQTGWDFVDLVDPLADASERITAVEDLAGGDQLAWAVGQSSGSPTVAGVDVDSDASFNADTNIVSFQVEAWKAGVWGDAATQYLTLIGSSTLTFTATGVIEGEDEGLTGSSSLTFGSSARLTAYANARGASLLTFASSAVASAYINAVGASTLSFTVASVLSAYANARGVSPLTFGVTGSLVGYGNMGGASTLTFTPTARLGAYASGRGASSLTFSVEGETALDGDMEGTSSLTFAASAALSAYGNLRGQSGISFSASASVTNIRDIVGTSSLTFAVSGRAVALLNAQGSASLSFTTDGRISAYANGVASCSLTFSVDGRLVAYAGLAGASSLIFSVSGRLASPFVPGVILFGAPIEVTEFKISTETTEFRPLS